MQRQNAEREITCRWNKTKITTFTCSCAEVLVEIFRKMQVGGTSGTHLVQSPAQGRRFWGYEQVTHRSQKQFPQSLLDLLQAQQSGPCCYLCTSRWVEWGSHSSGRWTLYNKALTGLRGSTGAYSLDGFNTVIALKPKWTIEISCSDPLHDDTGALNSPNAGISVCLAPF